jgi:23S rRNA pseudouridine1911/1915/1917 synthase
MLSQPVRTTARRSLPEVAADEAALLQLARRDGRRPFLRLMHRLDRATSGALLFAASPQALAPIARAWRGGHVERRYLALIEGEPDFDRREIDAPIARDREGDWRFAVAPGGRRAETAVNVVARGKGAALVSCSLGSGRTHQVRVHLAHLGFPVAGDRLYGSGLAAPRPLLHAASIALPHPRDGRRLEVESPLPEDFRSRAAELAIAIE